MAALKIKGSLITTFPTTKRCCSSSVNWFICSNEPAMRKSSVTLAIRGMILPLAFVSRIVYLSPVCVATFL